MTSPLEAKRHIGYVPESAAMYESLTGREHLALVAALHRVPSARASARANELLEVFGLADAADQRLGDYSKGMKQKVLIAAALLHRPDVLLLDEPLNGLDANSVHLVKEVLRGLAAQGKTILFCSHLLDIVERMCSRILVIAAGQRVAEGTAADIVDGVWRGDARPRLRAAHRRDIGRARRRRPAVGTRTELTGTWRTASTRASGAPS